MRAMSGVISPGAESAHLSQGGPRGSEEMAIQNPPRGPLEDGQEEAPGGLGRNPQTPLSLASEISDRGCTVGFGRQRVNCRTDAHRGL
jgi:hypothetical protein